MNNQEKILAVEKIVMPYFHFEMDDFYGDSGGMPYPEIENLTRFFFKKQGRYKKTDIISEEDIQQLIRKIKELNIGIVELIKIPSFGIYIYIGERSYYSYYEMDEYK